MLRKPPASGPAKVAARPPPPRRRVMGAAPDQGTSHDGSLRGLDGLVSLAYFPIHDRSMGRPPGVIAGRRRLPPSLGGGRGFAEPRPPASGRDSLTIRWLVDTRIRFVIGPRPFGVEAGETIRDSLTRTLGTVAVVEPSGEAAGAGNEVSGILHTQFHAAAMRRTLRTNPLDWKRPTGRFPRRETPRSGARAGHGEESRCVRVGRDRPSARVLPRTRGPDRRGQAPKGAGGMPRRRQGIGRGRLR